MFIIVVTHISRYRPTCIFNHIIMSVFVNGLQSVALKHYNMEMLIWLTLSSIISAGKYTD